MPVDPLLPLELETGTPCTLVSVRSGYLEVMVHGPYGPHPNQEHGGTWHYSKKTGKWGNGLEYRLRNVVDEADLYKEDLT